VGVTDAIKVWHNKAVPAAGARTDPVSCIGYHYKTVYLLSNQDGNLDIEVFNDSPDEVDIDTVGNWQTLPLTAAQRSVTANTLKALLIEYDMLFLKVFFDPVADATVQCWVVRHGEE